MIKTSAIGEIANPVDSISKQGGTSLGFTLIELMVALTIMVLLVAATPIALNRMVPGYRLHATADQLVADLRSARVHAQAQGHVVVIACRESAYAIQSQGNGPEKNVSLSAKATLSCRSSVGGQALDHFTLYPDGSAAGGVMVVTDGKREAAVVLSELTGRVRRIG